MTTATGAFTLPRLKHTKDASQKVFPGAPTWARLHLGAGQYKRIRLEDVGSTIDPAAGRWVQVWSIPAAAWSPRDRIEIGPTPANVRIHFEIEDQYAMAATLRNAGRSR